MTHTPKIVDIEYTAILHETGSATLFLFGDSETGKEVWLPNSIVEIDEKDQVASMPEKWAIDKEIEGYAV